MAPEMAPGTAVETAVETAPETAPGNRGLLRRLLCSAGERCFGYDELLQEPWFSLSFGVLLCESCAATSRRIGAARRDRASAPEEARVTANELRSLELGGNAPSFLEGDHQRLHGRVVRCQQRPHVLSHVHMHVHTCTCAQRLTFTLILALIS